MNVFEVITLNTILILFPLLLYLFYIAYNQNFNIKQNNLMLDFALFSSFYLEIRFGQIPFVGFPLLLFNIVLLLAYLKNRYLSIIVLSLASLAYYAVYHYPIWLLLIEYSIYGLLYFFHRKNKLKMNYFITSFIAVKALFAMLSEFIWIKKCHIHANESGQLLFMVGALIVVSYFIITLFQKGSEIIKLHMSIKELEQEKQVRTSLFKITHEIKNPLAVCKGYLDMFDPKNPEHGRKYIPIMKDEVNRTLILLQDFLSMNKIKIEREVLDINLLLEETVTSYVPLFRKRQINTQFEISEDEVFMEGDYNRLGQVVLNIIKNAVESIPEEREGILKIWTEMGKDKILIYFEDNGEGISKKHLNCIREPFYTTKKNGTGLGVSLSYEIVEAHHGSIKYTSTEFVGTTVLVTLPIMSE